MPYYPHLKEILAPASIYANKQTKLNFVVDRLKKTLDMKTLSSLLIILLIVACSPGPPSQPQPACTDANACIIQRDILSEKCCEAGGAAGYRTSLSNSGTKAIWVSVEIQKNVGGHWVKDIAPPLIGGGISRNPVVLKLLPGASKNLDVCKYDYGFVPGTDIRQCQMVRNFDLTACFEDDPDCSLSPPVPHYPGLTPLNCLDEYQTGASSCVKISYSLLASDQQEACRMLRSAILSGADRNMDKLDLRKIFPTLTLDPLCSNRITAIRNKEFSSSGSTCEFGIGLPAPAAFPNSVETYSNVWIKFPALYVGDIKTTATGTKQVEFRLNGADFIDFTIQLDQSRAVYKDIVQSLFVTGSETGAGDLLLSGKYFICYAVTDIPPHQDNSLKKKK